MACQIPPLDKLTNSQSFINPEQLAQSAAADIAYELGIALTVGDTIIPLAPFIWAAIAIQEILGLFGGGRPKDQDTNSVIFAYNESAYWPLHALATNLAMALKNGAPISDSRPAVQAQFSAWKKGTIQSIQQFAGLAPGPQSPGYWQLQELINTSWAYSKGGNQAVLQVVKAIDCFTEVLTQIAKQPITPPPAGPPPVPTEQGWHISTDGDELADLGDTLVFQNTLIYDRLVQIAKELGNQGDGQCCANLVTAIGSVVDELTVIATAIATPPGTNAPLDLTPIVTALEQLATAAAAYPPAFQACCSAVTTQLSAIATALGPDLGKVIQNIADAINKSTADDLLPAEMVDEMVKNGSMPAPIAQFFSARPASWSISGLISGIGHFLVGGLNPDFAKELAGNIKASQAGQPLPYEPIHSLVDVLMYLVSLVGFTVSSVAVDLSGALIPTAGEVLKNIGTAVQAAAPGFATTLPPGVGAPAVFALKYVQSAPAPGEKITTANYTAIVQDAMGRAGIMGMTAWAAAMIGGFVLGPWEKYWGEVAAMMATAAGFEEISERWMGPFLDAVVRNRATQDANRNWPTRVPPFAQALALLSRRKIVDADAETLLGYGGLDPTWRPAMKLGAFRPVTPFVLASAFVDQPIDRATLLDILQDNAYSDSHANTMADAILYKSIANVRNSYLSAAVSGYSKGVVGDDELDEILTEFNFSPLAKTYVKNHVLILRREVLVQQTKSQVVPLVEQGLLTPDEGLQQLEAAGMQPWLAQLEITLAETKATIMQAKKEAAAERKLELSRQRNLTRVATAEFQRGVIDTVGLTAALVALGLDPTLVASIVAVQDATRTGRLRLVYGQLLSPQDAKILTEKVAAIAQQTKDQLITLDQAAAQLAALQVDKDEAQALIARWAALLKKSAGAAVLLQP